MGARLLLIIAVLLVLGLLLVSVVLYVTFGLIRGSGEARSATRDVSDFTAVNFTNYGEMTIIQDGTEGLTIDTTEDLLAHIETTVRDGTLTIRFDNRFRFPYGFRFLRPPQSIRYTLHVKKLEALDLSGAGTVYAEQLTADRLELVESGAGTITVDQLTAGDLAVTISGAGVVTLAGQATHQSVRMSGLGNYAAGDLKSQTAQVNLSGAGSATLWVEETLAATLSGAGSINYYGSPQTTSSKSGVGDIHSLGAK